MDLQAQEDELLVLSSIYGDNLQEQSSESERRGRLAIHLDLPDMLTVTLNKGKKKFK